MDSRNSELYIQTRTPIYAGYKVDNETPSSDPLIGKVISERYRVLERIGRGGFGAVYRVQHIRLDKTLALKVLFEHSHQNPRMIKRFEREARATCRIGHDNIVEITDFARDRRVGYYFVMEYLEGETLCDRLRKLGPLSSAKIVHVGCQITDALAATHTKGIVHRDLKPDNIFLVRKRGQEDFVKILDFGIAAMGDSEEEVPRLTRHGMMLGTPAYMSPEQAEGKTADHRSDIYSLGILLYEMTTGSVPFKNASSLAVLEMHRTTPAVSPREFRPDLTISPALEQVILRALRKPNKERYQSMREMYNDLVNVSQQIDMSSVVARRPEIRVDSPMTPPADNQEQEEPEWIDEDMALLDDPSLTPERVTLRPRNVTDQTQLEDADSRDTREEMPILEHDTHRDKAPLGSDDFPPPLPMNTGEHITVIESAPAFEVSASGAVPLNTLEIRTGPQPTLEPLFTPPPAERPSTATKGPAWRSPSVLFLSGFLFTVLASALVIQYWPSNTRPVITPVPTQPQAGAVQSTEGDAEKSVAYAEPVKIGDPTSKQPSDKATKVDKAVVTSPVAMVKVAIQSVPRGARVTLGGKLLGVTPVTVQMAKSESAQVFTLSLGGYLQKSSRVIPSEDISVVVKLAKRPKASNYQIWDKSDESEKGTYELFE